MGIGLPHLLILLVVVLLLFGRGKIPELMGDFAKGIRSFKKGLADEDTSAADAKIIDGKATHESTGVESKDKSAHS